MLDRAQKALGIEAFRWTSRTQIKARQYVGMLVSPDVRLEILPKIDGLAKGETRRALMRMIAAALELPVWDGEVTEHDYQDDDLLELLVRLFAQKLLLQLRSGLHRAYQSQEGDLNRLRGKLNTTRQFTRLATQPQLLACRYDEFTVDNPLNRLLLCAVIFLSRRSTRADTQRLLAEIRCHLENASAVSPTTALSEQFALDRTNRRWLLTTTLARLFLSSSHQTAHGETQHGIALLFDMNVLFESYVAAVARQVCAPLGVKVSIQGPRRSLARTYANAGAFQTRPDLTLERDGNVIILDTKWKRLDSSRLHFDVAQADAYQMHGYTHVYSSHSAILLYPHHSDLTTPGEQVSWRFVAGDAALRVITIDVADPRAFIDLLPTLLNRS